MESELVYRHRDSKKGPDWRLYVKVMRVSRLVIDNRNYAELLLVRCIGSSFTCRYSIFRAVIQGTQPLLENYADQRGE